MMYMLHRVFRNAKIQTQAIKTHGEMMKDEVKTMFRDINRKTKMYGARRGVDITTEIREICDRIDKFEHDRKLSAYARDVDSCFLDTLKKQMIETYAADGRGKLRDNDVEIMKKIGTHLLFGFHPLTHCTDLISLAELCEVMSAVYPDDEFFSRVVNNNTDEVTRRLGPLISRSKAPIFNKTACWYIPVDPYIKSDKPSTGKKSIWILRSAHKYTKLGPADLNREYLRQYENTARKLFRSSEKWETISLDLNDSDFEYCKYSNTYERLSASNIDNIRHAKFKELQLEQVPSFM